MSRAVQAALEELLQKAQEPRSSPGDEHDYTHTAVVMSMRFHFASTFAKLQEWPSEISKVLECSQRSAAAELVSEKNPSDAAVVVPVRPRLAAQCTLRPLLFGNPLLNNTLSVDRAQLQQ